MRTPIRLVTLTLALSAVPATADPPEGRIVVEALSFHSDKGTAGCLLWASADGFPGKVEKAIKKIKTSIHDGKASCPFSGVAPGTYAVSVMHDENDNGTLDTNFLGIPKEGVGVSNDAKGFMGPPKFDKAKFDFRGGLVTISLHMKYL